MKYLLTIALLAITTQLFAQSDFDTSVDKENQSIIYKGQVSFDDLKKEPTFKWLETGTAEYKPDPTATQFLQQHLPNYEMVVLLGTWCEDSQNLIPKLNKILQATSYPMAKYTMYGVDRAKEAKYAEHKLYKLVSVPTIILYKNHIEIGRVVETVKKSLEEDLVQIIETEVTSGK